MSCGLSFEIQELLDIIRVVVLVNLRKGVAVEKSRLKLEIDRVCAAMPLSKCETSTVLWGK